MMVFMTFVMKTLYGFIEDNKKLRLQEVFQKVICVFVSEESYHYDG